MFCQICIFLIYYESESSDLPLKHKMSQICFPFGSVQISLNSFKASVYSFMF